MNTMCGAVEGPASLRSHSTAAATAASVALAMQMRILSTPRGRSNRALLAPLLTPGSRRCLAVLAWFRARFFPSCQAATEHGAPRLSLHARPFRAPGGGGGCANWCVANRVWNVERLVVNKQGKPNQMLGAHGQCGCLAGRVRDSVPPGMGGLMSLEDPECVSGLRDVHSFRLLEAASVHK